MTLLPQERFPNAVVYMQEVEPDVKNSVKYPFKDMVQKYGDYWTSSIPYMIALAFEQGYEEIHLYGPGVASGTYDYFTEAIIGEAGSSRGDFTASEDDNVLVQGIATDKYGLGFFGLAYYEENQDKLKLVSVDGGNGPVFPNLETVSNGTYQPLSRPLFIYLNSVAGKRKEVQEFVRFYLENASLLSKEVGYVPLENDSYQVEKQKLESFIRSLE